MQKHQEIIVLGETARSALAMLGFEELRNYRAAKDCGRVVESKGFKIFLCTLPFDRNRGYWNKQEAKEKLKSFLEYLGLFGNGAVVNHHNFLQQLSHQQACDSFTKAPSKRRIRF